MLCLLTLFMNTNASFDGTGAIIMTYRQDANQLLLTVKFDWHEAQVTNLKKNFFLILKSLILTCVPKHDPPSHLPPHNISLGHPHAPAPSMLYPASDTDWRFNSYMIVYMLECHSPKSSHPLLLSPKVRYTHLCLFSCLAYRVIIAIFLNSIYMC